MNICIYSGNPDIGYTHIIQNSPILIN